jgi:hypothetical protein
LEHYARMVPEALDALTPEERRQVYGMLRLKVEIAADGAMEVRGVLSDNLQVAHENGLEADKEKLRENGRASWVSVQKCKTGELRFRALVAEGGAERLELTRA